MNQQLIDKFLHKAGALFGAEGTDYSSFTSSKFAELIVQDYAKKTIQGLMSDPAFVQAMDEYYENKWAHRFD
jgi:hypothetical protein